MDQEKRLINEYLMLFDHVLSESADDFDVDHWHSLEWNLNSVTESEWDTPAAGGERTIREMAVHIGHTFETFNNATFGDGTRAWDDYTINGRGPGKTKDEAIMWIRDGHSHLRESIAGLADHDLDLKRMSPWGYEVATRRILEVMLQHTTYHVGEINHLRSMLQGNDTWGLDDMGRE